MRSLSSSELRTINFLFGDLSDLTPEQKIDLVEWYRASDGSGCGIELEKKILFRLSKEPGLTVAVIKNRLRNKYTEDDIYGTLENLKAKDMVREESSVSGKAIYF